MQFSAVILCYRKLWIRLWFTDTNGRWVFELANYDPNIYSEQCFLWHTGQQSRFFLGTVFDLAEPCPCNKRLVDLDDRFFYDPDSGCAWSSQRSLTFGYYQVDFPSFMIHGIMCETDR